MAKLTHRHTSACGLFLALLLVTNLGIAAPQNRAPGFSAIPKISKIVVMPPDVELFSISAGGVLEPKADWTEQANGFVRKSLEEQASKVGLATTQLTEAEADDMAEIGALHAAVARSIALHQFGPSNLALPTKGGNLDWSLGDAVQPLHEKSHADYALFVWLRDSYASSERQATMVVMALLGVGLTGGFQTGYASLVDLKTGQVVWFNNLFRGSGDLRQADKAAETIQALLKQFPEAQ